jgi:Domain of unknown function (DUF927)
MATLAEFMSRVVPWPQPGVPGVVNVHWTPPDKNGVPQKGMRGRPFTALEQLLSFVTWANSHAAYVKDIYFCLSMQAEIGKVINGKVTAKRSIQNALLTRALWTDIDVKEGGYKTLDAALEALQKFIADVGLPPPSALVSSGGGLHVYWISDRDLTLAEWAPYAEGLKAAALKYGLLCDYGLTTDAARVLRIPGTFNRKLLTPRPVTLLGMMPNDINFEVEMKCLLSVPIVGVPRTFSTTPPLFPGKPAAAFAGIEAEGFDGITSHSDAPLAWEPLMGECAFFTEGLCTGGAEYSQPMWNLSTLLATFLENGHAFAHRLGNQHAGYSAETTNALWDRKHAERKDRGLGWPSCHAIQAAGCKSCASCPHFGNIKSPLNITVPSKPKVAPEADAVAAPLFTVPPVAPPLPARHPRLHKDYEVDRTTGYICKTMERDIGNGQMVPDPIELFLCRIDLDSAYAERDPDMLQFTVSTSLGLTKEIVLKQEAMATPPALAASLAGQGVKFLPSRANLLGDFFMTFLDKLHAEKEARRVMPYGWFYESTVPTANNIPKAFSYGGTLFGANNQETPCGVGDAVTHEMYMPVGDVGPWFTALDLVIKQNRPELEVLTAVAFAAPLMTFTGTPNGTLSAYGQGGGNKSTAVEVGVAVWGHRKLAKQKPGTSQKSMLKRMGEIRNLPLYWDDIRQDHMEKTQATISSNSDGTESGTLTRDRQHRAIGAWEAMMVITSNNSMYDYMVRKNKNDAATLLRTLEFKVDKPADAPSRARSYEAAQIVSSLDHNYGIMGVRYARLLASDPAWVKEKVNETIKSFGIEVQEREDERFWLSMCAGILAGAELARLLGVNFHIPEMRKFLVKVYLDMRNRVKTEAAVGGTSDHTDAALSAFIIACSANTIRTNRVPPGPGRPTGIELKSWPHYRDNQISLQWALDSNVLRFSKASMMQFLSDRNVSASTVFDGLKQYYGMTAKKADMTAGTGLNGAPEDLCVIRFDDQSWLHDIAHNIPEPIPQDQSAPGPVIQDTGLSPK